MEKLFLLDAYALIYRAYYAMLRQPRINSKGFNTSAVMGFVGTLEDIIAHHRPQAMAVCFDPPGPTFRHEEYPEYKAQREATPEDIRASVPIIKDIVRAYGLPILEVSGFEADDVAGTAARQAAAAGYEVHLFTPDKDYAQLVGPHVFLHRPSLGATPEEVLGPAEVCEKYGLPSPAAMVDYLGLMGDASDNVPGCPGVGAKTAAKLIAEFGSAEALLARTAELKGALRTKVETGADLIRLSCRLVTIRTDAPLTLDFDALRFDGRKDETRLGEIFEELEMRTLARRVLGAGKSEPTPEKKKTASADLFQSQMAGVNPGGEAGGLFCASHSSLDNTPHTYQLADSEQSMRKLSQHILTKQKVAIDTETTSVSPIEARLVGMSFATAPGQAWYVPVPADDEGRRRVLDIFRPVFSSDLLKVGQNLKYDFTVLLRAGVELAPPLADTMLAHYLLEPEGRHSMDHLSETLLDYTPIPFSRLVGPGRAQSMADLAPADVLDYAAEDADVTLRLWEVLSPRLDAEGLRPLFDRIEMPLVPVLARMETEGVRLDATALDALRTTFEARLAALEGEIYAAAGHPFTITSPRQVGTVLFDELQLSAKARKTSKTGQYSTGEEVLESLRGKHPIVPLILQHRALKKLLSTYVEALPRLVNAATGRVHTSFNQAVTATGRLSSSGPNLQNIPVRGDDGREVRRAFVPDEGCTFLSADYSQIELRIMAHLSGDEAMIADFRAGRDIHAATAARLFHKPLDQITRDERRKAKTANFGIIYGISAFGLAERMDVSRTEAKALIDNYFATYPRIRQYIDECIERARRDGQVQTLFGRRRRLPDIASRNAVVRGYAERNAVNAPIQGTAADIIKLAMIAIDRRMRAEGLRSKMILQVHDELNFSVPCGETEQMRRLVCEEMERAVQLSVPLPADCGTGANWLEAH